MINLSISGNSIIFEFQDNQHYLNNGTIEVPLNSLTLVTDESNMATFKKAASNDVFISCLYSELGMTKAELEAFYKENMVGGGVDPADVLDIVESATSYYDGVEYDSVNSRINFKHNNTIEAYVDAAPFIVDGMVDNVAISGGNLVITFNTDSGKQPISIPLTDIFDPNNYYNKTAIDAIISGVNDSIIEDEEVISSALNDLNERKLDASAYTPTDLSNYYTKSETSGATEISAALNNKQDELTAGSGITISGNVISADGGGGSYSAGRGIDITNDVISFNLPISADTTENILLAGNFTSSPSSSNYQDAITVGKNNLLQGYTSTRKITNSIVIGSSNKIVRGMSGGNKICTIGFNNEIAGGETCIIGFNNNPSIAKRHENSFLIGNSNTVSPNGDYSGLYLFGQNLNATKSNEFAIGKYNTSSNDGTSSGNTFFSIGDGTSTAATHNAFEIRQNGDIYITKNGADVKLQDQLGGGAASSAITSGDTNAVQGGVLYDKFDEVEQVTAAALNTLNTNMGGLKFVKLSQQEYDDLAVKDSSTMYVII